MKSSVVLSAAMTALAMAIGLAFGGLVALAAGENPFRVLGILFDGAFGSPIAISQTLFNSTPLIFTGLSVMWAFRVGLFNIGAEGQLLMGSLAMVSASYALGSISPWMAWPILLVSGFLAGGIWGAMAGWVRSYRGAHEVLVTILLNFISYGIFAYFVVSVFRDVTSQAPETWPIPNSLRVATLDFFPPPVNWSLVLGLVLATLVGLVMWLSVFGFRQRLVGAAPGLARWTGLDVKAHVVVAMFVAGGIAGLGGINDVFGYIFRLREGFSNGTGFVGIAVALLGRNSPFGVVVSALLFGALQTGSLALDIETRTVTREMTLVIQAALIIALASEKLFISLIGKSSHAASH